MDKKIVQILEKGNHSGSIVVKNHECRASELYLEIRYLEIGMKNTDLQNFFVHYNMAMW